jgi:hypothetical protein
MFSVRHVALGRGTSRPGRPVNRHRYQCSNRLIITIALTASLPCSIDNGRLKALDLYSGLIYTEAKMSSIPSIQVIQPWISPHAYTNFQRRTQILGRLERINQKRVLSLFKQVDWLSHRFSSPKRPRLAPKCQELTGASLFRRRSYIR